MEAVQRGLELGRRMGDLLRRADEPVAQCPWLTRAAINTRYIEANLPGAPVAPGPGVPRAGLCPDAELGFASSLGGANHPVALPVAPVRERKLARRRAQGLPGSEAALSRSFPEARGGQLSDASARPAAHRKYLARLRPRRAHRHRRRSLERRRQARHPSVQNDSVVVGLANGYIMYVTTPEEYEFQHYEGASTLYGPATAPWLAQTFAMLARHMNGDRTVERWLHPLTRGRINEAIAFKYETATAGERLWRPEWDTPIGRMQTERKPLAVCRVPGHETPTLCFYWVDAGPSQVALTSEPWLELVRAESGSPIYTCSRLDLEPLSQGGCDGVSTIDDRGTNFFTRIHERRGDGFVCSSTPRSIFEGTGRGSRSDPGAASGSEHPLAFRRSTHPRCRPAAIPARWSSSPAIAGSCRSTRALSGAPEGCRPCCAAGPWPDSRWS